MKRILILTGLISFLSFVVLAQTQRTSRTNSRPHDRSTLISDTAKQANQPADKASPEQDMDKNNPPPKSKNAPPADDKSKGTNDDKTNK